MTITEEKQNGISIFRISGSLNSGNSFGLKDILKREGESCANIIVVMEDVTFIDSAGLGALVSSYKSVAEKGGDIKVVGLQKNVRMVFELTRLHRIFDIHPDVERASAAFEITEPSISAQ